MMILMMMMTTNKNQIKQRYNILLDAAIYIKCIDTRISGSMKFIKNSQRKERGRGNTERGREYEALHERKKKLHIVIEVQVQKHKNDIKKK